LESHAKSSTSQIAGTFDWSTTHTQTTVFGLSTQSSGERRAWQARHDFALGRVDPASYREPDEHKHFAKYNGSFTWQQLAKEGNVVTVRAALQVTKDQLLPFSEQFSVGGLSTVRGYPEGFLAGDGGYYISVESTLLGGERAHGFVFFDHGAAFPFKGNYECPV
jgi:hemolysin activation/secretion protein